jgi:hypothetical protein
VECASKKYNFQIHQMYFHSGGVPPLGKTTQSSYYRMMHNMKDIRILHFSASRKPSHVLFDMDPYTGWENVEDALECQVQAMYNEHGSQQCVDTHHWRNDPHQDDDGGHSRYRGRAEHHEPSSTNPARVTALSPCQILIVMTYTVHQHGNAPTPIART